MEEEIKKYKRVICILLIIIVIMAIALITQSTKNQEENDITSVSTTTTPKTDAELKKGIDVEYAGVTSMGRFVMKVTNNNDETVYIENITTNFKNSEGVFQTGERSQEQYFGIEAGKTIYVTTDQYFTYDSAEYPNYEFEVNMASEEWKKTLMVENISVSATETDENNIVVEVQNNNDDGSVRYIDVGVTFFKDNELVATSVQHGNATVLSAQSKIYFTFGCPDDYDYFEAYLISARNRDA